MLSKKLRPAGLSLLLLLLLHVACGSPRTVTVTATTVGVSISPTSGSVSTGGTLQLTASVAGTSNTAVSWSASAGVVSSLGLYTAPGTAGTYSVTATSVADPTKSASATVTVTATTVAVSISPTSGSVSTGGTLQLTASVTGTSNTAVSWAASAGVVSSLGLYTAPGTTGTYSVTATSVADPTKSASATVTVTAMAGTNLYLATTGVDSGNCSNSLNPCRTFSYVDGQATSGDVVHVAPGTYTLTPTTCIVTNTSGVTWQSDAHGAATIDGGGNCLYLWHNSGNSGYLKIFGFQFTGVQVNSSLNSFGLLLEGSEGNFEIAYNTFHDLGGSDPNNNFGAALSPAPWGNGNYTGRTCSVHDNIFRNIAPGGSFLYNGYSIYAICGNNGGDPDPRIYNNLIYNEGSIAVHMWHAADYVHVYNNTIDHAEMGMLVGTGDQGAVNSALFDIGNNIVSNSHYGIYAEDVSGYSLSSSSTFNNNLTYNNAIDWAYNHNGTTLNILTAFPAANNLTGDPLYIGLAVGNYVLGPLSPAIGNGESNSYAPALDLNGKQRPLPPSVGAYEP